MSQIATSIEQSKRLQEAGIDPRSCDMRWTNEVVEDDGWGHIITRQEKKYHLESGRPFFVFPSDPSIPGWSLSALWQMVYELDRTYEFPTELSADELMETLVSTIVYRKTH